MNKQYLRILLARVLKFEKGIEITNTKRSQLEAIKGFIEGGIESFEKPKPQK